MPLPRRKPTRPRPLHPCNGPKRFSLTPPATRTKRSPVRPRSCEVYCPSPRTRCLGVKKTTALGAVKLFSFSTARVPSFLFSFRVYRREPEVQATFIGRSTLRVFGGFHGEKGTKGHQTRGTDKVSEFYRGQKGARDVK
jgi:hypothetical protein